MADIMAALRGMKDIYDVEYDIFRHIENTAYDIAQKYGFKGLQTPLLEMVKIFDRTLGESSDVVSKELYHFQDKKGREIALRPEFTAGIMRAILSNKWHQDLPLKLFSAGPLFRYDRPQEGRQRQFHQLNFEYIGKYSPVVDAELIAMAQHLLEALEIADDLTLELNSLGCEQSKQSYQAALQQYFAKFRDELSEDSRSRLENNPLRILDSKDPKDKEVAANAPLIDEYYSADSKQKFEKLQQSLNALGIKYQINPRLVRGLDYYSETIFEYTTNKLGAQNTILAGGRYDKLASMMGSKIDLPAIGFAAGFERIMLMRKFTVASQRPVSILPLCEAGSLNALILADKLRQTGVHTIIEHDGKVAKRLQSALANNSEYAIFIGEEEVRDNSYKVKHLDDKKEQSMDLPALINYLVKAYDL